MWLLDTNVLSEFMCPHPAPQVVAWLDAQIVAQTYTSAITRTEIELGLALMPVGKRQAVLAQAAQAMFEQDFAGRCLAFDEVAADWYAQIVAARTQEGRPISVEDAQIAAIALAHQLHLVTRNVSDFVGIQGLALLNPWD